MSVGKAVTKADIDAQIAALGVQINYLLQQAQLFNTFLTTLGSAALQAAPYSYTAGEATTLLAASGDLDKLRLVYAGLMYVTFGATVNTGTPTANDGTHFGYPFNINVNKCNGFGF